MKAPLAIWIGGSWRTASRLPGETPIAAMTCFTDSVMLMLRDLMKGGREMGRQQRRGEEEGVRGRG